MKVVNWSRWPLDSLRSLNPLRSLDSLWAVWSFGPGAPMAALPIRWTVGGSTLTATVATGSTATTISASGSGDIEARFHLALKNSDRFSCRQVSTERPRHP